jgi:RNA polymerase sigma-70 factor (ECF subfamily)
MSRGEKPALCVHKTMKGPHDWHWAGEKGVSPRFAKLVLNPAPARLADLAEPCVPDAQSSSPGGASLLRRLQHRMLSDEALAREMQDGTAEVLTILFERYAASLFRIAKRILRNEAEAEDAIQQIFLDVFRSIRQFDPEKGSFKTWLMLFAYQRIFNCRRQLIARRFFDTDAFDDTFPSLTQSSGYSLPEAGLMVEQIMRALEPRQRRTIELIYYQGLTAEEVSRHTGESVRVVRHNLYRGIERIRRIFLGTNGDLK